MEQVLSPNFYNFSTLCWRWVWHQSVFMTFRFFSYCVIFSLTPEMGSLGLGGASRFGVSQALATFLSLLACPWHFRMRHLFAFFFFFMYPRGFWCLIPLFVCSGQRVCDALPGLDASSSAILYAILYASLCNIVSDEKGLVQNPCIFFPPPDPITGIKNLERKKNPS